MTDDDPRLGTELGGYRLTRVLGRGGMGAVYAGEQAAIDAQVAIKVITTEVDAITAERFVNEARAANRVRHDGVVNVFGAGLGPDGRPYLVMELVPGESVAAWLARGPVPPRTWCRFVAEVARAVAAMHAAGVIHRDLKPSNLFVTAAGHAKVLDLGIAKLTSAPSTLTAAGAALGTLGYMAPEQAAGRTVDARADVYALGVLLFEGLAGRAPFVHDSLEAAAAVGAPPGLDDACDPIVARAMAPRAADRYADATALADALEAVAATLPEAARARAAGPPVIEVGPPSRAIAPTADLRAPADRLGRYVLEEPLGRGGAGTVMRGFDPIVQRPVAIKLLHARDDDALRDEAQRMARVSHPNVVQVYEVGHDGDRSYLVMEYAPGVDVATWLRVAPRTWRAVVDVFVAAGRGLAAAHAAGVVHRDFKPANAIVGDDGRVRVGDFGLAADGGAAAAAAGTPAFMAPEQVGGGVADPRSDQFAWCASLWRALHDEAPFAGATAHALAAAARRGELRAPRADVPSAMTAILRRGLAGAPDARFASMDALLEALTAALRPRRARTIAIVAGATAVAAIAAAVAALAWPRPPAPTAAPRVPVDPLAAGVVERFTVDGEVRALAFDAAGARLAIATDTRLYTRALPGGAMTDLPTPAPRPTALVLGDTAIALGTDRARVELTAATGAVTATVAACPPDHDRRARTLAPDLAHAVCYGDTDAVVREVATGRTVATLGAFAAIAYDPGGARLAVVDGDTLALYALPGGRLLGTRRADRDARLVVGRDTVALWRDRTVTLWRPGGADLERTLTFPPAFAAIADDTVAVVSADGALGLITATGGWRSSDLGRVVQGAMALDRDTLALFHPDGVSLIEPATGVTAWLAGAQTAAAPAVADGRVAFASGAAVTLWTPPRTRPRDDAQPGAVGPAVRVGDRALWRFADRLELRDATGALVRTIAVTAFAIGVDEARLAIADPAGVIAVVELAGTDAPRSLGTVTDRVRAVAPTATGALVATTAGALHVPSTAPCLGEVLALDPRRATALVLRDGELVHCALLTATATPLGAATAAARAAFCADGSRLLVLDGARLRVFDDRHRVLADRTLAAGAPTTFAFAAEGGRLAIATATGVAVVDPLTGVAIAGPAAPDAARVALSPDGRLAAAFVGGRLVLWPSDAPHLARDLGRVLPTPAPTLALTDDALIAIGERTVSRWSLAPPTDAAPR